MVRKTMITMVALSAGFAAQGAESPLDAARRCAQVQDSLQRLVCYDRLFPPGAAAVAAPAAPPAPAVVSPAPAPVAAPASPATAVPVAEADRFGAESVRRTQEERQSEAPPRSLTATVKAVRETRPNVYRMNLENGQVWDQMDMDITFSVEAGDTVQIERGRMGGYRMSRTSRGGSSWVRVNRLK